MYNHYPSKALAHRWGIPERGRAVLARLIDLNHFLQVCLILVEQLHKLLCQNGSGARSLGYWCQSGKNK